jgi:hypothetical protein
LIEGLIELCRSQLIRFERDLPEALGKHRRARPNDIAARERELALSDLRREHEPARELTLQRREQERPELQAPDRRVPRAVRSQRLILVFGAREQEARDRGRPDRARHERTVFVERVAL